jgi:hypothetical protein
MNPTHIHTSPALMREGREAGNSLSACAEVKNRGAISPLPLRLQSFVLNYTVLYKDNLIFYILDTQPFYMPITVAKQSKACTVFTLPITGIVDSNPSQGMNVCARLFCVCVVLCVGSGLATC